METQTTAQSQKILIRRIDGIIQELQELRQMVLQKQPPTPTNLANQLFGTLGHGTWDEYDMDLDWARFES